MTKIVYKGVEVVARSDASFLEHARDADNTIIIERNGKAVAIGWTAPASSPDSPAKAIDFAMILAIVELILKILGLFGGDDE